MKWDVASTWVACNRRFEQLDAIPPEARTEAESRAWYSLARWIEQHSVSETN